jgi:hypothetical protein
MQQKRISLHVMQCGMMMPIEWVKNNGEGSELMEAFRMALDALNLDCRGDGVLTFISVKDEPPPDNERVLAYRPCMEEADTGPYSVQWGWAAKRDASHWAHLPSRKKHD